MPLIDLSIEHGRTFGEARVVLESVVQQLDRKFRVLIKTVEWSDGRDAVKMTGLGFSVDMKVDARRVHVTGDMPMLGGLLASPFVSGLKQIVQQAFQKRLQGRK